MTLTVFLRLHFLLHFFHGFVMEVNIIFPIQYRHHLNLSHGNLHVFMTQEELVFQILLVIIIY